MKSHLLSGPGALRLAVLVGWVVLLDRPALAADADLLPRGHVYFQTGFEENDALHGWQGAGRLEAGYQSRGALSVERKPGATESASIVSVALPAEAMRGYLVRGSAMVRAENVSSRRNPWNGIKCMLAVETPDRKLWPQAEIGTGTFDWRPTFHKAVL